MNFNIEKPTIIESTPEKIISKNETTLEEKANLFLGEKKDIIKPTVFLKILAEVEEMIPQINEEIKGEKDKWSIRYDKREKRFHTLLEGNIRIGEIIAARRWGINVSLRKRGQEQSGDEKKAIKIMSEKLINDKLYSKLNRELALELSETTKMKDALMSNAYKKIAERSENNNEQLGIVAEQIIIGTLEAMSIDRPDLGFNVIEANAYQDVHDKIDFIIATHQTRRGVGVNRDKTTIEEKSIGIQFTTNKSAAEHKMEQISKAIERGVHVDDIVYVDIDGKIMSEAINKWENSRKPMAGPWKFLPAEIRKQTLQNLFKGLLTEEQEKSLVKDIK